MKNFHEIHWHDTKVESVVERLGEDELVYVVDYPDDWEANVFSQREIIFSGYHSHSVDESPFCGNPTILGAAAVKNDGNFTTVKLTTNAGSRTITAEGVTVS